MSPDQAFALGGIAGAVLFVFLPDTLRRIRGWWRGEPVVVKNWRWPV